jgi:hypothetical protein
VSPSSGSTGRTATGDPETVLLRTATTDPVAALEAASVDPGDGPVLAVLAMAPRERLERRLAGAGFDLAGSLVADFPSLSQPTDGSDGDGGKGDDGPEPGHDGVAGLSMELVGRSDRLAETGGVVYLDSLGPFVSAVGFETAFRFLVIVTARTRAAGVPLVARLDPDAVDPTAAGTLAEVFDRVVEVPPDRTEATG